ncbi:MAG: sigma-70 family RNA polymerase sigma factor [Oscillospiraceae bacterium]|nr:sigma-70 family RNA polymerase sigma factor [Oscillospiraceae bacterium]
MGLDGDGAAVAAKWYREYRRDVYRLAYMVTRNPAMAEDICQDVFLTVLERPAAYENAGGPKPWLLTVARNKALNLVRRESRTVPLAADLPDENARDDDSGIVFLDILKPLNPTQRQIVLFRAVYGLKHKDIARMLGLSPAAVRQAYGRALKMLKEELK